jgi:peptidyl-prolyl cis-trans isomerase SurA
MKKPLILTLLAIVPYTALLAQSAANDPIVMTINGQAVPRSEFEYSYNKNNGADVIDKKTVEEYADLFINYKLKVCAALAARLDTAKAFRDEYAMYRDQQIRPTMVTDADVLAEARKLYERAKEQIGPRGLIQPAHILIKLSTKASQAEQDKAKSRADSVYRALKGGADFAELAKKVSDDKGSAARGGLLPWLGPGQTLKEFEDAAYALETGQMSQPVLSPVGWHVIRMAGRKQLEPFDTLKAQIVQSIEQQGIRERIAQDRVSQQVAASDGALTAQMVMDSRADSLAAVDSDMKYLMQEYHDGLLLYEISKREVWDKAAADEAGLDAYFRDHKKDYVWDAPRYRGIAYYAKTKDDVKAVKKTVKKVPFDQWAETLRHTFNQDSVKQVQAQVGVFKQGDNHLVDSLVFKVAAADKAKKNASLKGFPFSAVYGKKLKSPQNYNDVRLEVVEDYQDMLEKAWVYDLRRRYKFSVNQDVLKTVNKHK